MDFIGRIKGVDMARLTKTSKHNGYLDGKPGGRNVFKLFEQLGINIRTVRRYQNTEREGGFHTVEIRKRILQEILEDKLEIRTENDKLKEELEEANNKICYLEQFNKQIN